LINVLKGLEAGSWTFAKTMPRNPHFWSLRKDWENPDEFLEAVRYIRENGVPKMFGGREYTVLYHNGFRYWTMDDPLEDTYLINRAEIDDTDPDGV
jgi:hypothetical protein|tara:strand:- start:2271 stop:2558 length:288 start_codon:yes stop_codon:yes gene_type:complete